MGGPVSSQFRSESERIWGDFFFQEDGVDEILRVFESIERRFTKLEESYGYVENWDNYELWVGRKNMEKGKEKW